MLLKHALAKFVVDERLIKFGSFQLKSGRISPYFFNFGGVSEGAILFKLARYYAEHIKSLEPSRYEVLFGPAYKGIPLVVSTAIALSEDIAVPYAFNRKEAKSYGDSGYIIGAELSGKKVLALDDVITSGRTVRETKLIVEVSGGELVEYLVALDRCEKIDGSERSAVSSSYIEHGVGCTAVSDIWAVLNYMKTVPAHSENVARMEEYLQHYAASESDVVREEA